MLRRKFIGLSAYIGDGGGYREDENNDLSTHFKKLKILTKLNSKKLGGMK